MSYTVKVMSFKPTWAAVMKMTIPDYSRDLHRQAISTIKKELKRSGVELSDEPYDYSIAFDSDHRIELVDIEFYVAVKAPGTDNETIQFKEIPMHEKMIRIISDSFSDVHTGLAEWMHENDYMADGNLRQVISDEGPYVFDCAIKPSGD